jgi:hypothetical protein
VGQERCAAVRRREAALPAEYTNKARRVDREYCDTMPGAVGPVEARLQTYDAVRGLVFGAWGEASPYVEQLLKHLVEHGVRRHRRTMRARAEDEARAALTSMLRRRWAMTAVRENARLLLARLRFVGWHAGQALQRRSHAAEDAAARARRAACRGVRSWRN